MEPLIVFLIRHWYLIFLLMVVVYQIRNKRSRASGEKDARRAAMPPFGGGARTGQPTAAPLETSRSAPPARPSMPAGPRAGFSGFSEPPRDDSPPKRKESPFAESRALGSALDAQAPEQLGPGLLQEQLDRQQLMRGIVWAEILGPPRAKKPYRK